MPFENQWNERGLYRKFFGQASGQEVLESNLYLHGDARFDDLKYVINDFTEIEGFRVSKIDINLIASTDNAAALSNKRLKIAIITIDEVLREWVKIYCEKMENSPYQCKIFRGMHEARDWATS